MIRYFKEETNFNLKSKSVIRNWIKSVIEERGKSCRDINIIFCSDPYLLQMNKQYLGHDYYTDIITFDYCEGANVSGDIYISVDTVSANAVEYGQTFEKELHRVIIHGVLHLLGFDDHSDEQIQQMRAAEDAALLQLENLLAV